jgi:hypothetical protein
MLGTYLAHLILSLFTLMIASEAYGYEATSKAGRQQE